VQIQKPFETKKNENVCDFIKKLHGKSLDQALRCGKYLLNLQNTDLERHGSHRVISKRKRILAGAQFKQFDLDGDNSMSRDELESYLRSHHQVVAVFERAGEEGFQRLVRGTFRRSDVGNCDGRISFEEFLVAFTQVERFNRMLKALKQVETAEEKAARLIQRKLSRKRRQRGTHT